MEYKLKIILIGLLAVLSIVIIKLNSNSNLEIFRETNLSDYNKIEEILKLIDYGKNIKSFDINNSSLTIIYDVEMFNYKTLEKNSSILFYLINGLKVIDYKINNEIYSFDYDKIALIYNNFKGIKIDNINSRYDGKNFSSIYLGNINGNIDLFDTSDLCIENYIKIYQTNDYVYYITCSNIDDILVVTGNKEYKLLDALEEGVIEIDDLFNTNIKIKKDGLDKNEDID